jgi:Flp pilus assembly protein CpaB
MPRGARTAGRPPDPAAATSRPNGSSGANGIRPIPQRRFAPNGRAALGGLLVVLAVLALETIGRPGGASISERYVVARHPLAIGSRITAGDLTTARIGVPSGPLRSRVFNEPARLVGAIVLAPVGEGELIQASAVVAAGAQNELRQISVPVEAARALGDRLQPGELVDVIATFGSGGDAFTVAVVSGARVVARDTSGGTLGDRKSAVVVLAVSTVEDSLAIANAVAAGQISLVRVSGVGGSPTAPSPYRAPRPGGAK